MNFDGIREAVVVLFWMALVSLAALIMTFGFLILIYLLVTHLRWV